MNKLNTIVSLMLIPIWMFASVLGFMGRINDKYVIGALFIILAFYEIFISVYRWEYNNLCRAVDEHLSEDEEQEDGR